MVFTVRSVKAVVDVIVPAGVPLPVPPKSTHVPPIFCPCAILKFAASLTPSPAA